MIDQRVAHVVARAAYLGALEGILDRLEDDAVADEVRRLFPDLGGLSLEFDDEHAAVEVVLRLKMLAGWLEALVDGRTPQ